jgi:hypothetical protein
MQIIEKTALRQVSWGMGAYQPKSGTGGGFAKREAASGVSHCYTPHCPPQAAEGRV